MEAHTQHDESLLIRIRRLLFHRMALAVDAIAYPDQPSYRTQIRESPCPPKEARSLLGLDRSLVGIAPAEALPYRDLLLDLRLRSRGVDALLLALLQLRRERSPGRGAQGIAEGGERPRCSF